VTENRRSGTLFLAIGSAFLVLPHLPFGFVQTGSVEYVVGMPLTTGGIYLLTIADPLAAWWRQRRLRRGGRG
jgi:hypothetical protein